MGRGEQGTEKSEAGYGGLVLEIPVFEKLGHKDQG